MSDKAALEDLTGGSFLERISRLENKCAATTMRELPKLGSKAPHLHEVLGMALAHLDCAASCYWGCSGSDHRLEFLTGRTVNSAYSALSLATKGYYDQALSVARTIGEAANLLALFVLDKAKIEEWKIADEVARKKNFSPVKIRLRIEALAKPIPIDRKRYGRLSVFSIHAIPDSLPQAHNQLGKALTVPVFQPAGFLLALNEIALAVLFVAFFAKRVLSLKAEIAEKVSELGQALAESVGGILVTEQGRPWFQLN